MPLPVAFLGLGRMGHPMARRLLDAGFPLAVWNRTVERGRDLAAAGARLATTPADAVREARVVVTMLADPAAVGRVLDGPDGILSAVPRGAIVVDCSTIGPDDARRAAEQCAAAGARFVEAPVMGSITAAGRGALTVLVGGEGATIDEARPVLERLGATILPTGAVGSASTLKLTMNLLVGGITELLAESIVLAERSGLDTALVRQALASSVLASPFLGYKAPQLLERDYAPLFTTTLMLKDLDLALELAHAGGVRLPATSAIRETYAAAVRSGAGEKDFAAVRDVVEGKGR